MHTTIFQILDHKPSAAELLKASSMYEDSEVGTDIDYIGDEENLSLASKSLSIMLPKCMFSVDKDEIIIVGNGKEVVDKWITEVKKYVDILSHAHDVNISDILNFRNVARNIIKENGFFYFGADKMSSITDMSDFILDVLQNKRVGDKLYIGSSFDCHF